MTVKYLKTCIAHVTGPCKSLKACNLKRGLATSQTKGKTCTTEKVVYSGWVPE